MMMMTDIFSHLHKQHKKISWIKSENLGYKLGKKF